MLDTTTQRRAFDFLLDHFRTQEPFTKNEFHDAVPEWSKSSLDTYWSKQIKRLLARAGQNQFRVTEAFRPYANWDSFRKHIATQVSDRGSSLTIGHRRRCGQPDHADGRQGRIDRLQLRCAEPTYESNRPTTST